VAPVSPTCPSRVPGREYSVASSSGRRIYYTFAGRCDPNDPVLLFCHGMAMAGIMPATWKVFAKQRQCKNDEKKKTPEEICNSLPWTIVVPDRGGYGKSTLNKSYKEWTYADATVDYIAVLDDVHATKFAVCGPSSGGNYALDLACTHPDRVSAVLLNCADATYGPGFPKGTSRNQEIPAGGEVTYIDGSAMLRPGTCSRHCCCSNPCCCCCCCCPSGLHSDTYVEVKEAPFQYSAIKCPVIIVQGTKDDTCDPNCSKYHASRLPNAKLAMVDGMGHCEMPSDVFDAKMIELHGFATGQEPVPVQAWMSK